MIEGLDKRFLGLTSDPGAAATLVLAEVLSTREEAKPSHPESALDAFQRSA